MSVDTQASVIHSHQLNYKPVHEANPKYRFLRLPLNNINGSSVTLTGGQSQLLEFKLPTSVYNLSQSFLGYTISTPAENAAWVQEDAFEIASNVYFGNASGLDVCNLPFANKYTKISRKIKTKFQDFISNDVISGLSPSNLLTGTNAIASPPTNVYPVSGQNVGNSIAGVVNYIEPKYLRVSAAATIQTVTRLYPLHGITDTIFAVDKDLYVPTDMYARFNIGPNFNFSYSSTLGSSPVTGAAVLAGAVTIGNVYLYLAVETNQLIIDSVINKVNSGGLKLNVPYTVGFRNTQSSGTSFNVNLSLTSQYGKSLRQIMHTVWGNESTANAMLDSGNYNGTKITSYNTFLNSRQLQDSKVCCLNTLNGISANYDDWRENKRFVAGSVILNKDVYGQNWFHLDRFFENNIGTTIPDDNRLDGYDLTKGTVLWQLQANTVDSTWYHYTFATFNREVIIDSQGIRFDV